MATFNKQGLFAPGTYDIEKIYLKDHKIDIRFKVIETNVYESIFQPCMTADVTLIDVENMVANFPIIEGNIVQIEFKPNEKDPVQMTIDNGNKLECEMEIIKITSRTKSSSQDLQTYTLRLASCGWSNNIRDRVSRAYKKKKYSEIATDIFNSKFRNESVDGLSGDLKFKKGLITEETYGEYSVVIPRWKPITCFNWLAGRSQSKRNKDAVNYLFWEDKEDYHFESIENMVRKPASAKYYIKLQNIELHDERNYFNISSYSYEDTGDILLYANNGTLGSRLITHDIVSKQVTDHSTQGFYSLDYNVTQKAFDYCDEFKKVKHVDYDGIPLVTKTVSKTLSSEPGNTRLFVHGKHSYAFDGIKDDKCEEWLRQRTMQKPMLKYVRLNVEAVGNFARKAGDVIHIELPSPEVQKGLEDRRLSGNYLITTIRHIFKPSKHDIVMECIKDSYVGE